MMNDKVFTSLVLNLSTMHLQYRSSIIIHSSLLTNFGMCNISLHTFFRMSTHKFPSSRPGSFFFNCMCCFPEQPEFQVRYTA